MPTDDPKCIRPRSTASKTCFPIIPRGPYLFDGGSRDLFRPSRAPLFIHKIVLLALGGRGNGKITGLTSWDLVCKLQYFPLLTSRKKDSKLKHKTLMLLPSEGSCFYILFFCSIIYVPLSSINTRFLPYHFLFFRSFLFT